MPIYEYECTACKHRFERSQRFSDAPLTECPECGGLVRRVLFPAGIVFKGSGWYITDSRKSTDSSSATSSASSSETKTETKTETKSDSKSDTTASKSASTASAAKAD